MAGEHFYGPFHRQYGVALTSGGVNSAIQVVLFDGAGASYTGAGIIAGVVKVSKDGGAEANITNLPTQVAATGVWTFELTATEMQAAALTVRVIGGAGLASACITVETAFAVATIDVDSSQWANPTAGMRLLGRTTTPAILATGGNAANGITIAAGGGNTHGLSVTGAGTGAGIRGVAGATGSGMLLSAAAGSALTLTPGGAGNPSINETANGVLGVIRLNTAQAGAAGSITLDAAASAVDDFYNNVSIVVVGGTGAGQSRSITDYVGATKVATIDSNWATNPDNTSVFLLVKSVNPWDLLEGAEPSGAIADNSTFRRISQYLKRRFFNKVEQTATTQTVRKDDSATALTTMTCSADSVTQTKGKTA